MKRTCSHRGFTLVELLVVITVIGLLSGMFIVAYRGAQIESFNAKTRGTIMKISEVLNSRMQEYEAYPVSVNYYYFDGSNYVPLGASLPAAAVPYTGESSMILTERTRLLSLREIIKLEMPDHLDDIKWADSWRGSVDLATFSAGLPKYVATGNSITLAASTYPVFSRITFPSRALRVMQRLSSPSTSEMYAPITHPTTSASWSFENANAELLFLIVEDSTLNGSQAIELFGKSEIGDTDGDGLNEFLDANRRPIQWIRWPGGFGGIARYHPDLLDPSLEDPFRPGTYRYATDSLDRMQADPGFGTSIKAQREIPGTFPLVASSGTDGVFGLRFELNVLPAPNTSIAGSKSAGDSVWYSPSYATDGYSINMADPWFPRDIPADRLGALLLPKAFEDDITNYDGSTSSL